MRQAETETAAPAAGGGGGVLSGLALVLVTLQLAVYHHEGRFLATAYCQRGHTATGRLAGPGSVAVDPRVVPLGSRVWVQGYGAGVADDTGPAIRGGRVDLWFRSCRAAIMWGVRWVTVRW